MLPTGGSDPLEGCEESYAIEVTRVGDSLVYEVYRKTIGALFVALGEHYRIGDN